MIPRTAPDHCYTDELTRLCRVPLEKRSLRTAREALLRTAPALEGPRLIDLGSGEKLKEILRDRQAFHSFEDHLRMSMEKTQFHKRVQTAHSTVEEMIHTAHANPAGLKRGRTSPAARRLAVRCELARAHFEARDLRCGHISSHACALLLSAGTTTAVPTRTAVAQPAGASRLTSTLVSGTKAAAT